MTPHLAPALAVELAHQARRRQPLPPLNDLPLSDDDAMRLARAEEARRDGERVTDAFEMARTP